MKQKLPEEKSSYKKLYLNEIGKTKILLDSWAKCSLIELLIAKFCNKKEIVNSPNFQIITLFIDLCDSKKNKNIIVNSLILFALAVSFSIYCSNTISLVETNNFALRKVHRQNLLSKNYIGIYKKYFQKFNQNFDIFSHNIFRGRKKKLCLYESFNISTGLNNQIFFNDSFRKEMNKLINNPDLSKNFLDYYLFTKENQDYLWARKQILQNLENWGESPESLVQSSFRLKEGRNLHLSNYMKVYLWQFLTKNYRQWDWDKVEQNFLTEKTFYYFHSKRNNPKLWLTLENILSDATYKFSKCLAHKTREFNIQIRKGNSMTGGTKKHIDLFDPDYYVSWAFGRNFQFNHFKKFHDSHAYNYNTFDWANRMLYLKYEPSSKPVFLERTFLKKSLVKGGPKKHLDSPKNILIDDYIRKNLFSERKIKKVNPNSFLFPEPLLMDESIRNFISIKIFTRFFENLKKFARSKKNIESDDSKTISWKLRKYHSNFLRNYFLPFNSAYNVIYQNSLFTKGIWYELRNRYNRILIRILNSLLLFSELKKKKLLISCLGSKEHLLIKTDELNTVMDRSNGNDENPNFFNKMLLMLGKNSDDDADKSIKSYCSYYNNLLKKLPVKVLDSRGIYKNYIFHKYSISWKRFVRKSFIYNVENAKFQKPGFDTSHWLCEIENLSKTCAPYNLLMKLELVRILEEYFQNSGLKNIEKTFNSLKISTNIHSNDMKQKILLSQASIKNFELNDTNIKKLLDDTSINETINDEIVMDSSTTFYTKNHILLGWIRNRKFFLNSNLKFHFDNSLINFDSNHKENFLVYWKEINTENNIIIYSELLKNFSKNDRLNEISIDKRSLFLGEKEISQIVQSKSNQFSVFEIFTNKFDKTKFRSFYAPCKNVLERTKFHFSTNSKKDFPEHQKNELEKPKTIFTNEKFEIEKIGTGILPDLNNVKIKEYFNILKSETFIRNIKINNLIFQLINKIYVSPVPKYSRFINLGNEIEREILIQTDKVYEKSNNIDIFHSFEGNVSVRDGNYTDWFFTSEWWEYNIHIFREILRKRFIIIGSYFEYFLNISIKLVQKNLSNLYKERKSLYTVNLGRKSRFSFEYTEKNIVHFLWSDSYLINNFNNLQWAILSSIAFVFLFYQNSFSIFIGSDCIDLWKYFENIKYLTDTSRAFYFTELLHRNKIQLGRTENLLISFFSNLKHYAKNIRFYLLTKKNLNNWLINNKSLDLSRRKRNLLVQSLITSTRIKEYGFESYFQLKILNNQLFGYQKNPQQGLSYIRYVSKMFEKNLVNSSFHLADKWIFFASLQKIISSQSLQQTKKFDPKFQKIPISLQLGLSWSKGILLIGPVESGRSYLIKNLAADCSVPPLGISINKLMYNKPDIITESWMNILIESLRRLNLTLDLARGMSPCLIWIRNIHELDVNRPTQNIESDPTFLLGILLKHFQINSLATRTKNNIVMIGSTHVPEKVDPSLISPDRLDRILNIRLLNTYQRKNQFPILLKRNNLQLKKNLSYFNEFGSRTLGYNMRDLVALTNEISLIGLTKNESFVYDEIMKLAFHRQVFGSSHTNSKPNHKQNFKILLYKIGRAIIQNIMIEGSTINPLNINNYLWKKNFYYLSKWYLEPSMDDSIIKESTILVHVLVCLAGAAARDSWSLLDKDSHTSISLDKSIENDLDLAFSILETFSSDFPWLETCKTPFFDYGKKEPKIFLTKNFFNIMHSGIFAVANKNIINTRTNSEYESVFSRNKIPNQKICEFNNTAWSPRFWRLNFSRSHLFDWIKRPNDFESFHTLAFIEKKNVDRKNRHSQITGKKKEQLFYERILPRVRKRNVEELESQFENILLEEQFEILGFFGSSTQYQMEYQLDSKQKLFIGKRILWDPTGSFSQNRHFVFSRSEFFVDEEMLRRLYITYGVRREREQSLSSHRIKRFFICRGYNKELINKLSVRWWNQLPMDRKENIHTLKRIEKIGIRLKRPQIFTPVYLYQRWLIENIPGKFSRLDLLTHRDRWIRINKLLLNDSFTYNILLESYQYLFEFFLLNRVLLTQITKMLLRKKWIFQNEIVGMIDNIKNKKS
nr:Ycf2 [Calypogeia suecica]WCP19460.1 Ycf2 [Calypogeia suecica]